MLNKNKNRIKWFIRMFKIWRLVMFLINTRNNSRFKRNKKFFLKSKILKNLIKTSKIVKILSRYNKIRFKINLIIISRLITYL